MSMEESISHGSDDNMNSMYWSDEEEDQSGDEEIEDRHQKSSGNNVLRAVQRQFALDNLALFSSAFDEEFWEKYVGVSRDLFSFLLEQLGPYLSRNEKMAKVASKGQGKGICATTRLLCFLRMAKGALAHDVMATYKISKSALFEIMSFVPKLILARFSHEMKFRNDIELLEGTAQGFSGLNGGLFTKCVGALDGTFIRIKKPSSNCGSYYNSRYGSYGINVQAVADSRSRFMAIDISTTGSTHDNTAFNVSHIVDVVMEPTFYSRYFIVADEAYTLREGVVVPFSRGSGDEFKTATNYYISQMRVCVEMAFGILKGRFAILDYLQYKLETSVNIILALALLHNMCISWNPRSTELFMRDSTARTALAQYMLTSYNRHTGHDEGTQNRRGDSCPHREDMLDFVTRNSDIIRKGGMVIFDDIMINESGRIVLRQ